MDTLTFVEPQAMHEDAAMEYISEHVENGEDDLHGAALLERLPYGEWLDLVAGNRRPDSVAEGWVPASTFFVVREDDGRIIGTIDIRHYLNEFLRSYGGHIGYGVRPSERGQGYAKRILAQALDYARNLGIDRVMLSCYEDNAASRRVIEANGGVLEREFVHTDGKLVQVFWIEL